MLDTEIDQYINWKASYAPRASVTYALHLKRFNSYAKKDVEQITLADVVSFRENLNTKFSPANVNYALTIVKDFIGYLEKQRREVFDPSLIKVQKVPTHSHRAISQGEYDQILSVLRDDEFWNVQIKLAIRLLWETGIRVSELCDINIEDVDSQKPQALIITKKNKKQRWIFWSQNTHDLLIKFLGVRLCMNQRSHLFIAKRGRRRPTPRTIQRWIKKTSSEADIKVKITPHSFRHGKAHQILNKGGNVADIARILGHNETNPIASFSYLKLNSKEQEQRAKRFL